MMEFLDKLFSINNFGLILFGVTALLIVLFFIVLFFGKKDEKERVLEETHKLELANLNAFSEKEKEEHVEEIEVREEENKKNEIVEEDKFDTLSEFSASLAKEEENEKSILDSKFSEYSSSKPVLEPLEEKPLIVNEEKKSFEYNDKVENVSIEEKKKELEDISSSIAKELEELEGMTNSKKVEDDEPKNDIVKDVEITKVEEIKKFKPTSVFSSVYSPEQSDNSVDNAEELKEKFNSLLEDLNEPTSEEKIEEPIISNESEEVPDIESFLATFEEAARVEEKDQIDYSSLINKDNKVNKNKMDLPKKAGDEAPKKYDEDVENILKAFSEVKDKDSFTR